MSQMLEWGGVLIFCTRMTAKFMKLVKVNKTNKKKKEGANHKHNKQGEDHIAAVADVS